MAKRCQLHRMCPKCFPYFAWLRKRKEFRMHCAAEEDPFWEIPDDKRKEDICTDDSFQSTRKHTWFPYKGGYLDKKHGKRVFGSPQYSIHLIKLLLADHSLGYKAILLAYFQINVIGQLST